MNNNRNKDIVYKRRILLYKINYLIEKILFL